MIKNFKIRSIQLLTLALIFSGFTACNKDISLSLDNTRDESMGIVPVDSFRVNTATYQLDDIPTSATGVVLVGKTSNSITGSLKSTSYMRLGINDITTASIPTDAVYDSINFVLKPNKYYYGDTTQTQKIAIHRVTQPILLTEVNSGADANEKPVFVSGAAIYNNQNFTYDQTALGSLSFKPHVKTLDSVAVKLDNNLGLSLFNYIKSGDSRVTSNENFVEFFKGIAIVPDNNNSAIIGYKDTVFMELHYNSVNAEGFKTKGVAKFNLADKTYQFNKIETDRTGTPFANLSIATPELKSASTNGEVYLEGSTGTVVKLNFPTLLNLVNDPTVAINKAELVIETESKYNNSFFKSPSSLILMVANQSGNPIRMVNSPFSTTTQQVNYVAGNDYGSNAKYTFNLIEYLNNIRKDSYYNTSLFVSLPIPSSTNAAKGIDLFSTIDRLIIAKDINNNPKIKLNILYTKF